MSKLIFQGDLNQNFGEFLPVPYIEHVYVYDDYCEVQISLFFNMDDEQDIDTYLAYMKESGLKFFLLGAGSSATTAVLQDGESLLKYAFRENKTSGGTDYLMSNVVEMGWEDFQATDSTELNYSTSYSVEGEKIVKVTSVSNFRWPPTEDEWMQTLMWNSNQDITLFAFSALEDIVTEIQAASNWRYTHDNDSITGEDSRSVLDTLLTSNFAYEHLFEAGELASKVETSFVDASTDLLYNLVPLQAFDGFYYKVNNVTHKNVVAAFQKMVDETKEKMAERQVADSTSEEMLNNISYIITEYGGDVVLLRKLNDLRKTFPNKLPTNPVGKLYRTFRNKLYTFNRTLIKSDRLIKRLTRNPKVLDSRAFGGSYTSVEHDSDLSDKYVYFASTVGESQIYSLSTNDDVGEYSSIEYTVRNQGYWWFDYEKLLRKASALSSMINIQKFEELFGMKIPYEYLMLHLVMVYRNSGQSGKGATYIRSNLNSDSTFVENTNISATYDEWDHTLWGEDYKKFPYTTGLQYTLNDGTTGYPIKTLGSYEYASHVTLRNVDFSYGSSTNGYPYLNGYRLMTFELQDVMPYDEWESWDENYYIYVQVRDTTYKIMRDLITQYETAMTVFDDYVDGANEFCSYNSFDDSFNTFFADAMREKFAEEPETAPWYKMAALFYMHAELIEQIFDGDYAKMKEKIKSTIEAINPDTGTFTGLTNFATQVRTFYNNYYTADEVLTTG